MVSEGERSVPLPDEVEMKEVAGNGSTAVHGGRRRHSSNSSFASVSSSSPTSPLPPPPLEGTEMGGSEITSSGGLVGPEDEVMRQTGQTVLLEDNSPPAPASPSNQSHDITIETGSTHTNHIPPPPHTSHSQVSEQLPTTPSPPFPATVHTHLLHNSMTSDLLHDAIHDHSPQQRESFLNGALHISGRSSLPLATLGGVTGSDVEREVWAGVRVDRDGLVSRVVEQDWRLLRVMESYEARIAGLRQELVEVKAVLRECVREGERGKRRRRGRGSGEEEGEEEEEAATTGASVLEDNQVLFRRLDV